MSKIVIIEDETQIARMYQFKLEKSGYEVRCASNGMIGLELIELFRPELILLDLMMPVMGGEEMLRKVRATHWGTTIKVIILTNISEDVMTSALSSLRIERYIVKANYTPGQVVGIVSEVLATKPEN